MIWCRVVSSSSRLYSGGCIKVSDFSGSVPFFPVLNLKVRVVESRSGGRLDKQIDFLGGSFSSYSYYQSKVTYFSTKNFTVMHVDIFTDSLLFVRDKNMSSYM